MIHVKKSKLKFSYKYDVALLHNLLWDRKQRCWIENMIKYCVDQMKNIKHVALWFFKFTILTKSTTNFQGLLISIFMQFKWRGMYLNWALTVFQQKEHQNFETSINVLIYCRYI